MISQGGRDDLGISFCRYIAMNFIVACHVLQFYDNELAYVIYKKFLQHISGIAHILKLSDKYSYDIYLAHHIYILGPLSILSLQISAFSKIIILIGLISAQSIIVHKASALLNQLKISD